MYDLNLCVPDLTTAALTEQQKFRLLKNYLYELNEALAVALSQTDTAALRTAVETLQSDRQADGKVAVGLSEKSRERFAELKEQILSTAESVTRTCAAAADVKDDAVLATVAATYATQSAFGDYRETTDTALGLHSDAITANAGRIEQVDTDLASYKTENNAEIGLRADAVTAAVEERFARKDEQEELEERLRSLVTQTASGITDNFSETVTAVGEDLSTLGGTVEELVSSLDVYIRRGELETGVYGVEVGRSDSVIKARFTNDRLSFLQGSAEVAYISDSTLFITRAEVLDCLRLGSAADGYFTFDATENGLEVRWSDGV